MKAWAILNKEKDFIFTGMGVYLIFNDKQNAQRGALSKSGEKVVEVDVKINQTRKNPRIKKEEK